MKRKRTDSQDDSMMWSSECATASEGEAAAAIAGRSHAHTVV